MTLESIIVISIIDAHEHRDAATIDIPGTFMQADRDELIHLRLEGKVV